MQATLKQIDGLSIAAYPGSNHWVTMDAPPELGGHGSAPRPMEMVLMGIAGCAAMDVLAIMKKKQIRWDGFEMEVKAQRAEEHPQVFTRIDMKYIFYGSGIPADAVERSIELTEEKYCGATAMIRGATEVQHAYEIRETRP